jgi:hypothetical protein
MWKVLRDQHQAETGAAGGVVFSGPLRIRGGNSLRAMVEVVAEPGEEHQQRVFLGQAIVHDRKCADRPQESRQKSDFETEELLRDDEKHHGRQALNVRVFDLRFIIVPLIRSYPPPLLIESGSSSYFTISITKPSTRC